MHTCQQEQADKDEVGGGHRLKYTREGGRVNEGQVQLIRVIGEEQRQDV